MQLLSLSLLTLSASTLTSAHFELIYPYWRGDSFADGASQWSWPCANVSQANSTNNRTMWPTSGGSVVLVDGHDWALTYINLGLGNSVDDFNVTLLHHFNQTSNGTLCIPRLSNADFEELGVRSGDNASIQVITITHEGNALYNCADITFSDDAETLDDDMCQNSTGVSGATIGNVEASSTEDSDASSTSESPSPPDGAGVALGVPAGAAVTVAGLFALFLGL